MTAPHPYYPYMPYAPVPVPRQPTSGLAIAALITAIAGLLFGWLFFGIPCIPALVLAHLAVSDTTPASGRRGRALAVAALAIAYPGIIIASVIVAMTLAPFL